MISNGAEEKKISFTKKREGEYALNMEYWDNKDFIILKFHHDDAPFLKKIQTKSEEYQNLYKIDVKLKGEGKSPSKLELTNADEFYRGTPYFSFIMFIILSPAFFYIMFISNDLGSIWTFLFYILQIMFAIMAVVLVGAIFLSIIISSKHSYMIKSFESAGGKEYIEYVESPGYFG